MTSEGANLPLVAIVTPVYNGAAYLEETMGCVQAQTYGKMVHVLLDNASTDETPSIIEKFRNGRVPLVIGRNSKTLDIRENWEVAVRSSPREATYFLVLCADDLISPDAIEKMVSLAERDPSIGVVGCLWRSGPDPRERAEDSRSGLPSNLSVFDGRWFVKSYLMQLHFATSPQYQLIRRDILDRINPFYSHDKMLMDVDACLKAVIGRKYGLVHERLGFTRVHGGRITDRLTRPNRMHEADWVALIDRYGPSVMSRLEFDKCKAAYLRYYYRRMLLWRFYDGNRPLYDMHFALLKQRGCEPGVFGYLSALAEWAWLALRNRRQEVSVAKSLWPDTWAELRASSQHQDNVETAQ
ncbi:glycosyltransferase family 2 protein [Bradyrhizobium sp.]|uniref:glycosyltransferase family 2 protein n=1 Tax=Bradyrhizobium sp. TaxID=376 RepID=UPI003C700D74